MTTARTLARETVLREITAAARARLHTDGPAGLSLRAVARDIGMVSSAVYRYVPSRDALLTALLVETYNELGAAVERAAAAASGDPADRWLAAARGLREWCIAHPGEFALLYGTPVPGYAAPADTIAPAQRVTAVLASIAAAAHAAGGRPRPAPGRGHDSRQTAALVAPARAFAVDAGLVPPDIPDEGVVRTLMALSSLFGAVSYEMWGHLADSVSDPAAWFDELALRLGADIGIGASPETMGVPPPHSRR